MRYLIVSCVYPPEPVVSSLTSAQVAMAISIGHDVTVVSAFPNRPSGRLYDGFRRKLVQREKDGSGIDLIRCFSFFSGESNVVSRFLENMSFGIMAGVAIAVMRRPGVIYANTWPIFASGMLALIAKIRRIPIVISIQDIYPESLAVQGRISMKHPVMRLLKKIDTWIADSARHMIVISNQFAETYRKERGIDPSRMSVIPNWFDSRSIELEVDTVAFRQRMGIPENIFLLTYGGNIGVAAGVETVIQAMDELRDTPDICLLVAGDGSQLKECRRIAQKLPESRIKFYSPWPPDKTSVVLRSADLLVLPTRGKQSLASVPSKLIVYMFVAKPVLALAMPDSETKRVVQEAGCGWMIDPDQPKLLAEQIMKIHAMERSELTRRGEAGREYAAQHFSKDVCLSKVIDVINNAADQRTGN